MTELKELPDNVIEEARESQEVVEKNGKYYVVCKKHLDHVYYKQLLAVSHAKKTGFQLFNLAKIS